MGFNFGFFGTPEHRVFNYKPRYYDPAKEELRKKFGHVDGTDNIKDGKYVPGSYIKGSLRDGAYSETRSNAVKGQKIIGMISLILAFAILILIAKYFGYLFGAI
ncbi:MAG: hypothetical protein MJY62_05995 [Bacteroidales bacterium]|nr:hypothetical protein [Bacteroidales bacterium]